MSRITALAAIACGLALIATVATPSESNAFCRTTTTTQPDDQSCRTDGEPLEWRRRCMSYAVDVRGSQSIEFDDALDAIDASFETWMDVTCDGQPIDLEVARLDEPVLCQEAQFNERGPNVNTVAFLSPFESPDGIPYAPSAFAVTIVWRFDDGEIVDADMLINEDLGPYTVCPDAGCTGEPASNRSVDLQNIVTHEAGHFFGIAHSDVLDSTMYGQAPRGEVAKRTLDQDDIDALCTIYPPGSFGGGCDFTPLGGLQLDCSEDVAGGDGGGGGGCAAAQPQRAWRGVGVLSVLFGVIVLGRRRRRRPLP
ncbi:MAG: matrixin family metalloprotease [Myxococcota bacterium]